MFEADVNYLAVVLGAIASQAIGAFWYSPAAFAARWMELRGYSREDLEGGGNTGYLVALVASVVAAYTLSRLADMTGADTVGDCIALAAFVWAGFAATVMATGLGFNPRGSVALFEIEAGYQLASFLAIGAIVGAFQ